MGFVWFFDLLEKNLEKDLVNVFLHGLLVIKDLPVVCGTANNSRHHTICGVDQQSTGSMLAKGTLLLIPVYFSGQMTSFLAHQVRFLSAQRRA